MMGLRAVATAVVLLCAATARAQVPMPDMKSMSGIPRPDGALPTGTVTVRVIRGQLSNNVAKQPVQLDVGGKATTRNTDEAGRAEFQGVTAGATARATTTVDGERLESQEFPIPAQGGVRVMLVATNRSAAAAPEPARDPVPGIVVLGQETRFVFEFQDDALQVFYLLDILNNTRAPVKTDAPLIFDMPPGATSTTLLEGSTKQAVARGTRVTVTGPFAPGATRLQIAYQIAPTSGTVALQQKLPATLEQVAVVVQKVSGDMRLESRQLSSASDVQAQGGTYIMGTGQALAAGSTLELSLSGVPHHSRVPRLTVLAVSMFVLASGMWTAFFGAPRKDGRRAEELTAKREKLLNDLVRLERQRRGGTIDEPRYGSRRGELVRQLERIYGELDTSRVS